MRSAADGTILDHPEVKRLAADPEKAWEPYEPSVDRPWTRRWAAHLLRRAGFGANWAELQEAVRLGPEKLTERLWSDFGAKPWDDKLLEDLEQTFLQLNNERRLQSVWILRMLHSHQPLVERMVLFWHDHFATSQAKVKNMTFMVRQINLFRRYERGEQVIEGGQPHRFEALLRAVSRDPAMLVWLDGNSNRRAAPNENYARELFELFTLGLGHYTEKDIKEAARAFTGWFVRRGRFFFSSAEHDYGPKTVLGQTGNWNGDDIVRIALQQPAAARFLPKKLYRWFVNDIDPIPEGLLEPLAEGFRSSGYDTRWLVNRILRSRLFYSPLAYRRKVASPVDFVVGTVRRLELTRERPVYLATVVAELGQELYRPPSVAGWDHGPAWINAQTMIGRSRFVRQLVDREKGPFAGAADPLDLAQRYGFGSPERIPRFFMNLLLDGHLPPDVVNLVEKNFKRQAGARLENLDGATRGLIVALATQPEYQLI